ncbi:MAG TPA: TonB-dependent receptor [Flavobacteriales bacterium]|nr:TonB-dependent receptor [Flavobacteriales bacterium]
MNKVLRLKWMIGALIFLIASIAFPVTSRAQEKKISGTIKSDDGTSLPGVSVLEKGTKNGTVTDADGKFTLAVSSDATLVLSFIGMKPQEIVVGNQTSIEVTMESDLTALDEVVVVDYGYGTVKKSDMTGATASIGAKEIAKIPVASTAQALTGRLPGVTVTTTDGSPDADILLRVRGGGSITQNNSPLLVVDGFIVSSIRDIPPTDVESITVLKDAASSAIYGARASNGVIVITTKKAAAGKTEVSYNGFVQFKNLPNDRKYQVLSPYEFALANYEYAKLRSESDVEAFEKYFGVYDDLDIYKDKKPTDWQDELFGGTKVSQYHNINFKGGTDKTKVMLSLTNNKDQGLMINSDFTRNVLNFKIDHQIGRTLKFEASTRITNTVVNGAGTATGTSTNPQVNVKDAVQTRPVNGIADELEPDPNQGAGSDDDYQKFITARIGPVKLAEQDWREKTTTNYVLNAGLTWNVLKNLDVKSVFTSEQGYGKNLRFYGPDTGESFNNGGSAPLGEQTKNNTTSYRWYNTIAYRVKDQGQHKLDFLVGQEISSTGGSEDFIRSEDFRNSITPDELFANMQLGRTDRIYTRNYIETNRFSLFGRGNYMFNDKYIATVTFRSDVSSIFAKGNRVGYFPALALGWKMSQENFMQNIKFVNDLKMRVSYGTTGNDGVNAGAAQNLFAASTLRGPGWGNVDNVYYTPNSTVLYNPDLVWERTIQRNLGFDFTVANSRISGTLDVYWNTANDLLLTSAIPSNTGYTTQWNNIGTTSNKGVELGLTGQIIETSDFSLSVNVNGAINRGEIEKLDGTNDRFVQSNWASTDLNNINDYYLQVGGKIGDIYGYETAGYYSVDDFESYDETTSKYILKTDVASSGAVVGNTNIRPGFLKLVDQLTVDTDGDGKMDAGDGIIDAKDRKVIGNTSPKIEGGFGVNASYKGFDFSMFFNFRFGNDVYNAGKIQYNQFRRVTYGNLLNTMNSEERFTYIDVDGSYTGTPGEVVTDLQQLGEMNEGKSIWSHASHGIAGAVIHSWAVEDGSFLRLNNLSIGYSLPRDLISKVGLSRFRIYATGSNLHVWTKYSGYDPEVSSYQNPLTPGLDYSSMPRGRAYTIGVDLTF